MQCIEIETAVFCFGRSKGGHAQEAIAPIKPGDLVF